MPKTSFKLSAKGIVMKVQLDVPIEEVLDSSTVDALGNRVKSEMTRFMASGVSPVNGRKFQKYKNPDKYPKNVLKEYPDKKTTPVNLKLSGNLWNSFVWQKISNLSILFGITDPDVTVYAAVHNKDDSGRPDIPERRFLPTRKGETFNRSIMLEIKRLIVSRLQKLIK